jgi:hypothetical protein
MSFIMEAVMKEVDECNAVMLGNDEETVQRTISNAR